MFRVAYLISQYPTLSHTFIFREIAGLRRLGAEIAVASVLPPDREPAKLSTEERSEFEHCYYIRRDFAKWPILHLRSVFSHPSGYLAGLGMAARCSRGSIPQLLRNFLYFGEAIAAGQWMRRGGYSHLHSHFASLTALLVNRVFDLPFSVTIHGPDEFTDPLGQGLPAKVRYASLIVAISHYGASQIMRFSETRDWDKIRTIRLGICPADFRFPAPLDRSGPFRIVTVGRLAKVKAHALLIRSFALLRRTFPDSTLTIIGMGPEMDHLQELARHLETPVEFAGGLRNELVRELVFSANCFVLASFAEGVPVVLMEAMALGVPCVATRVMGVPELIEDNREGLLIAPGDAEALARAIGRLIENPALCLQLRTAARAKVLRDYDLDKNIEILSAQLQAQSRNR